ncbi:MAG: tRNA pseudouridine(55) synthase TruB [Pseudomonadales bacterium]|nr:tRNA pseudouridine(55) synthase TruB [Pseudomonadales bacterium]
MARRLKGRQVSGIILLDKAGGESSNASLQKVKRLLDAAKAGHTGSLDPLATGVLPLCFGEATKISQFLLDSDKIYRTRIRLGVKTDSGDAEGQVLETREPVRVSREEIQKALQHFVGPITQVPPMYSALKHQGVPLYKLARAGKTVVREERRVNVYSIKLLEFIGPEVELEIACSKGTYIRTIADDLGDVLGTGGHVIALRRIKAGPFSQDLALRYEELQARFEAGGMAALDAVLIPGEDAIQELPEVRLPAVTSAFVRQGQAVMVRHLPTSGLVRLYDQDGFFGIGTILDDGRLAPRRLFNSQ